MAAVVAESRGKRCWRNQGNVCSTLDCPHITDQTGAQTLFLNISLILSQSSSLRSPSQKMFKPDFKMHKTTALAHKQLWDHRRKGCLKDALPRNPGGHLGLPLFEHTRVPRCPYVIYGIASDELEFVYTIHMHLLMDKSSIPH